MSDPHTPPRLMGSKGVIKKLVKGLTRRLARWIKGHRRARLLVAWLGSVYIRLVFATSRWTVYGQHHGEKYWNAPRPVIVCFWHGRLLMVAKAWRSTMPFSMLISGHADGEMIARTVGHLGIRWIQGDSNTQGGAKACRVLRKALQEGHSVGITPDGPRGPCYSVSQGVVRLSLLCGVDVLPLAFSVTRHKVMPSWDRFLLALPFSRGVMVWGEPLSPATYAGDRERFQEDLGQKLMAVTQQADERCGFSTPL